jgi:ubiquinone/menaquinone biosynthesis C-methylase UbiE
VVKKQKLYNELARYYDVIYARKDYRGESAKLLRLIDRHARSDGRDLLEIACGTGRHAEHLKREFSVLATDVSNGMLKVARRNVRGVAFRRADMMTLDLGRQFDAITCLFSSIAYVRTYANLGRTLRNFSRHLKPGGVVLIEPWFTESTYRAGAPQVSTARGRDLTITRSSIAKVQRNLSILDLRLRIAEKDKATRQVVDRHELGMFEPDRFLNSMHIAGLRARFQKQGLMKNRGLYIGVKT